jgi:hypothetical protein
MQPDRTAKTAPPSPDPERVPIDWPAILEQVIRAPSSHNTQPWRFRIDEGGVALYVDRSRRLPAADPADRELTMSCGAALLHLRLALRGSGHDAVVTLFPELEDTDLLARVEPGAPVDPTTEEQMLYSAIPLRHTNRGPHTGRALPASVITALCRAAEVEGAWLLPVSAPRRSQVVALVEEGDRLQWHDRAFRRELASWIHPHDAHDGLAGYVFGLGPLIVRTFDLGDNQARRDHELAEEAPLLAVLGTAGDTPAEWLAAGQALARVLLTATANGVACAFLNQPVQVAALRPRLAQVVGVPGYPQLLLRMGYASDVHPSPRRPVRDVVVN